MAALNAFFDRRKLALTRARFHAWWEGEEYDEASTLAAIEEKLKDAPAEEEAVETELFDELPFELPGRLSALGVLWGEGRIRPGDAAQEAEAVTRIGVPKGGLLAVLGCGFAAPVIAIADAHPGMVEVFEWRDETFEALAHDIKSAKLDQRVVLTRFDVEAHVFTPDIYDGLLSFDDFAYCSYPPHLAQQIAKCLKPGCAALVESYVGLPSPAIATAFASSFAEPQIRADGDLIKFFGDAALVVESDEDITDPYIELARAGFKRLGENLGEAGKLDVAAARELAWEAEAWRARLNLMLQRRLERRRFILRKPAQSRPQAGNANAPEGKISTST